MPDISRDRWRTASEALDRVRSQWLRCPGVTAVDVGLDHRDPAPAGTVVIRVHVEDASLLDPGRIPEQLDGFAVRIIPGRYGVERTDDQAP